jgi:sulfur relay (sulfurtransferase) complex TusBCD TusD component (DsrE family)
MNKKHLRALYEEQKPPMSVFRLVDSSTSQKCLGVSSDIQATKNSLFFRLSVEALATIQNCMIATARRGQLVLRFHSWKRWSIKMIWWIMPRSWNPCFP